MEIELGNLVEYYLNLSSEEIAKDEIAERKKLIKGYAQLLEEIKLSIENFCVILKKKMTNRSLLNAILAGEGVKFDLKISTILDIEQLGQKLFKAYDLIGKVLPLLGLIHPINYTIMYVNPTTLVFYRSDAIELKPEEDIAVEWRNDRLVLILRLREHILKRKLEGILKNYNGALEVLSQHYNTFISPFIEYENSNNTGWRMAPGIAGEAFERHWELLSHSIERLDDIRDDDVGTEGLRWVLYRLSQGNDAFYTGPDTLYAQVKLANASIISNGETILNALEAVLKLLRTSVDESEIKKVASNYLLAFKLRTPDRTRIIKDLSLLISDDIVELARQALDKMGIT